MDGYWMLEYGKVFGGYIFLMFLWPTVVFWKHLRKRSKIYHFSFCVTVQIVLINTVVLTMGLLHILNTVLTACLFYGVFLIAVWRRIRDMQPCAPLSGNKETGTLPHYFRGRVLQSLSNLWKGIRPRIWEYILLFIVITFGMAYFSYGSSQLHTYGAIDSWIHHGWVNQMVRGQIFPDGIYPVAMHCFIYCLHALFGIRTYSIVLYVQCVHIMIFLISGYCLLREVFRWRYSPILVLFLYMTMDFTVVSMFRLQSALPMEFGLHTQFLCALYLLRYLKRDKRAVRKHKIIWDDDLFLFLMSLAASIAAHYYTTVMAFIFCASIALFHIKRIIRPRYFLPLIVSAVCGCLIACMPMAGALASGIPFEASINWGLKIISSNSDNSANTNTATNGNAVNQNAEAQEEAADHIETVGPFTLTAGDREIVEKVPGLGQRILKTLIKIEYFIRYTYNEGYKNMYEGDRGRRIFGITVAVICILLIGRWKSRYIKEIGCEYAPLILVSFLSASVFMAYNSPQLGLPVLIPNHRFAMSGHMIILAVMIMPADILFSLAARFWSDKILQMVSIVFAGGIYVLMNILGIFHSYLYFVLTRYEAAALLTNTIIDEFQGDSYTIVSPLEEAYQVEMYGEHLGLSAYMEGCGEDFYSLPTKYVFIYVEKKPIEYAQKYYFSGPSWLAKSGNSEIKSTEISKEAAAEDLSAYQYSENEVYTSGRTILESKAYEWCQHFLQRYPSVLKVYYEDEDFVCYYFEQDIEKPYNLAEGGK